MPILDTLTLSTAARNRAVAGEPVFRGKLADAIDLQIAAVQAEQKGEAFRGTSRNAAIFYGRNGHFGPIPADIWAGWPWIGRYGVLTWRAIGYARHVSRAGSILHAVTRPPIMGVDTACNTKSRLYDRLSVLASALP